MQKSFEFSVKLIGKVLVFADSQEEAKKVFNEMNELDVVDEMYDNGRIEIMHISEIANGDHGSYE